MRPKSRGNLTDKVDRNLLHDYLFRNADRNGRWLGKSGRLAEDLGINPATMSTIFREMITEGRMKKISGKFYINDPAKWAWENKSPDLPKLFDD